MSYSFSGSTHRLSTTQTPIPSGSSFTLFCWVKMADATPASESTPLAVGPIGGSDDYCRLSILDTGNGRASVVGGGGSSVSTCTDGTADAQNNTWFAIAGVYTNDGSNSISGATAWVFNGTGEVTGSPTVTPRTVSPWVGDLVVGRNVTGTSPIAGNIAHVAIWTKALSSAELTELATKVPSAVAASDLYLYWPLLEHNSGDSTKTPEVKQGGGTYDLTVTDATLSSGDGPTLSGGSSLAPIVMKWRM